MPLGHFYENLMLSFEPQSCLLDKRSLQRGYSLRKDLLRQIKGIAFEEDRAINEVMEEGLLMVIESRKKAA